MNPALDRMKIGNLDVSSVGIGTISWFTSDKPGSDSIDDLIMRAAELGGNFFDTAERYGSSKKNEALGSGWGTAEKVFKKHKNLNIKVATKFTPTPFRFNAESLVKACEESRERLGVESIDLYQIHMPDIVQPLKIFGLSKRKDQEYWDGLAECYNRGLVKNVGVSNYGPTLLLRAQEHLSKRGVPIASNQINYSLLYRKNGAQETVDIGKEMGIQTIGYYPLAMGILSGKHCGLNELKTGLIDSSTTKTILELNDLRKYGKTLPLLIEMKKIADKKGKTVAQVAINWVMSKGVIPIPGARNLKQLNDNLGARGWRLTYDEVTKLEEIADSLGFSFEGAGFKRSSEKFVGYGLEKWTLN